MPSWRELTDDDVSAGDDLRANMVSGPRRHKLISGGAKYGPNPVYMMPPHENMPSWFVPHPEHFNVVQGRPIGCRRLAFGEDCPGCALGFEVLRQDKEKGKKLLPSWNAYINVSPLDAQGNPKDDKIYMLRCAQTVIDQIRSVFDDNGGASKFPRGIALNIKVKGTGMDTEYVVMPILGYDMPKVLYEAEVIDLTKITEYPTAPVLQALIEGGGTAAPVDAFAGVEDHPQLAAASSPFADDSEPVDAPEAPEDMVFEGEIVAPTNPFAEGDAPEAAPAAATKTATGQPKTAGAPTPPRPTAQGPAGGAMARLKQQLVDGK